MIKGGAIVLGRYFLEEELFRFKPAEWFKILFFLVARANFQNGGGFRRGEGFTSYSEIAFYARATKNQARCCVQWLKQYGFLTTTKTTRGIRFYITEYDKLQTLDSYKPDNNEHPIPHKNPTINKNGKNDENVTNKGRVTLSSENREKLKPFIKWFEELKIQREGDIIDPTRYVMAWARQYGVDAMLAVYGLFSGLHAPRVSIKAIKEALEAYKSKSTPLTVSGN